MEFLLVILLLAVASSSILWPLRGQAHQRPVADGGAEALQAAREAKLQEIRDLELDLRLGKLSESDFRRLDEALRVEAVELARRLGETEGARGT